MHATWTKLRSGENNKETNVIIKTELREGKELQKQIECFVVFLLIFL